MSYWRCWRCDAANDEPHTVCEHCGAKNQARPGPTASRPSLNQCARCPTTSPSVTAFHDDTPVVADRGARLCASCWVSALRRRADASPPTCACGASASDHILEAKVLAGSMAWQTRFGSPRDPGARPEPGNDDRAVLLARRAEQLERFGRHLHDAQT